MPDFSTLYCKVVVIVIYTVMVSIYSLLFMWPILHWVFPIERTKLVELLPKTNFHGKISIEQKMKVAKHVVNRFA